jgi:MFS family permease
MLITTPTHRVATISISSVRCDCTAALPIERSLSLAGLVVLAIGSLDMSLEQSMILPALPALARPYEASLIATSWLATGYLLAAAVAIPLLTM